MSDKGLWRFLSQLPKTWVKLEFETDAGRVNSLGMLAAFILTLVVAVTGTVETVGMMLLVAVDKADVNDLGSPLELIPWLLAYMLICTAMLAVIDYASKKPRED